jgi:hypothetical protein
VTLRAPIVAIVLAAFAATIAVPGPQVVSHHHQGGEHAHVHAFVEHTHDGLGHHHVALDAHRPRPARHGDGLFAWDGDSADHVHVVSVFQPATPLGTAPVARVTRVAALEIAPPDAPAAPPLAAFRSRGPPPAAQA